MKKQPEPVKPIEIDDDENEGTQLPQSASEQLEQDEYMNNFEKDFEEGRKVAVKNGWDYTSFRGLIANGIRFIATENDFIQAYEDYCLTLITRYQHPADWAEFHYQDNWNRRERKGTLKPIRKHNAK